MTTYMMVDDESEIMSFINNETDWFLRQKNMEPIKEQKKKEREEKEARKRKRVNIMHMISMILIICMISTIVIYPIFWTYNVIRPKTLKELTKEFDVVFYTYVVEDGDSIHSILNNIEKDNDDLYYNINRRYYRNIILDMNNIENPDLIYPGDKIEYFTLTRRYDK